MMSWRINQVIDPPFSFKTATGPDDRMRSFFFPKSNQFKYQTQNTKQQVTT